MIRQPTEAFDGAMSMCRSIWPPSLRAEMERLSYSEPWQLHKQKSR